MSERFLKNAPILVALGLFFAVTHEALITVLAFAFVIVILAGARLVADRATMRLGTLVLGIVTYVVVNATVDPPSDLRRLRNEWAAVASAALAVGLFRALVADVEWTQSDSRHRALGRRCRRRAQAVALFGSAPSRSWRLHFWLSARRTRVQN